MSEQLPDLTITPEPTEEELVAIVAAVQAMRQAQAVTVPEPPKRSRWVEAARQETLRGPLDT